MEQTDPIQQLEQTDPIHSWMQTNKKDLPYNFSLIAPQKMGGKAKGIKFLTTTAFQTREMSVQPFYKNISRIIP